MNKLGWLVLGVSMVAAGGRAHGSDPDVAGIQKLFTVMDRALADKNEKAFADCWHPAGYQKNLVGGSGLEGVKVFRQGTRKGWYLKQLKGLRSVPGSLGAPWIVTCDIWSRSRARAMDRIFALVVYSEQRWKMLGGGEKLAEVEALGARYLKGEFKPGGGDTPPALPSIQDRACKRHQECRVIHRTACGCGPCSHRQGWALNHKAARRWLKQRSRTRCPRKRCAPCPFPLQTSCIEGACRIRRINPNRACKRDKDCVFAPASGCGCPPCGPTPRRAVNSKHAQWLLGEYAREQCPAAKCAKCNKPLKWIGRKAVCRDGLCEVLR